MLLIRVSVCLLEHAICVSQWFFSSHLKCFSGSCEVLALEYDIISLHSQKCHAAPVIFNCALCYINMLVVG